MSEGGVKGVVPDSLHHVSIPVRDLEKSVEFYRQLLMSEPVERPPFPFPGAWFRLPDGRELHLVENPQGTYRPENAEIDPRDCHFALRVNDFIRS